MVIQPIASRVSLLSLIALFLVTAACGPGPKSQALMDLERRLQDPTAREVKAAPGASKPYREARQYRRLALEAWDEGKDELSHEYAILGMLRYRTAAAIKEQHEAKARLEAANAKVAGANPEITALNQEQIKLADEVQNLEMQVAQARRRKEEAERRRKALASQKKAQQGNVDDAAQRNALQSKLAEVETAKSAADAVNASEHAPEEYNPAANLLKSLRSQMSGSVSAQMVADADKALRRFQAAKTAAEPKFEEEQEKMNPALRRKKLDADARAVFGGPYVLAEPAGVRVVLADAFARGSSTVKSSHQGLLKEAAKLAEKYDEFSISVEGYTSKGDATENLGLSQLRARAVEDYLTANGVKGSRIETKGQGQDQRRYPREPSKNERVELVFTR